MRRALSFLAASATFTASLASHSWDNLSIEPAGRLLQRTASGEPFFWQADTVWEIFHRLNQSDADMYLRNRAEKGFNVIQAVVISELNGTTRPNFYGELPLEDADPTRPNEAYFQYVDWVVNRAAEYGILVAMVPTWGNYVNGGWHNGPVIFNDDNAKEYGRYIGSRYPGLPKILGGDSNGYWVENVSEVQDAVRADPTVNATELLGPLTDTRSVWAALRDGLFETETEAGAKPFAAYHPTNSWIIAPYDTPEPYGHTYINGSLGPLSMDAVQSGHSAPTEDNPEGIFADILKGWDSRKNYENVEAMLAAFDGPVVDLENHYEGANIGFDTDRPVWDAADVRHGLYYGVFTGSAGFTYGCNAIWQLYDPVEFLAQPDMYIDPQIGWPEDKSWRETLDYPGAGEAQYLQKLLIQQPADVYRGLLPDRSILTNSSGELAWELTQRVAVLTSSDTHYWVYVGHGDAFELDLDEISQRSSAASASWRWYVPANGTYVGGETVDLAGAVVFTPPTTGTKEDDWVLELIVV